MTLERIRRAKAEEIIEIKLLQKEMLKYLKEKKIDDSLVLSALVCLTIATAKNKKIDKKNLFKLMNAICDTNNYKANEEDKSSSEKIITIQERIYDALGEDKYTGAQVFSAMSNLMIRIALQVEMSKDSFFSAMSDVWDEIEDEQ